MLDEVEITREAAETVAIQLSSYPAIRAASLRAGRPGSYVTFINGRVAQARIPMPRFTFPWAIRDSQTARKQSYDENSHPDRLDDDPACDLRTCIARAVFARGDRPLRPAVSGARFQCFLSGEDDADGRAIAHRYHGGPKSND